MDEFIHGLEVKWFRAILLLGIILIPVFGVLDFVLAPMAEMKLFWSLRVFVTLILIVQFLVLTKLKWDRRIYWHAYFFSFIIGVMISIMTMRLGGFESSYYAGLNLVIMAVMLFIPWSLAKALTNASIVMASYLILNLLTDLDWKLVSFVNNAYFMSSTILIAATIGSFKFQQIRAEFVLKKEAIELKNQQDGDYFLTSLLLTPLNRPKTTSPIVEVDFFLKQYKTVQFRNRNVELGGDINLFDSLVFQNKAYTLFVNGDAMGKSMQGAGGALVFGSLWHSLIESSKNKAVQELRPEEWIKETVISLHRAFENFEGAMLVSMVLGLIDEEAGFLYLVNAEHPFLTLYRNNRAQFIENETLMHKLGTYGLSEQIVVQTLQLKQNDILIAGSDARDEIIDEQDENRKVGFDHKAFLEIVNKGNGNIREIYEGVARRGAIHDDISLISIKYKGTPREECYQGRDELVAPFLTQAREATERGDYPASMNLLGEALEIVPGHPKVLYQAVKTAALAKDYPQLAFYADQRARLYPAHRDSYAMSSHAHGKLGDLGLALSMSECLRLREPGNVENLIHLADIHRQMSRMDEANKLPRAAIEKDPTNVKAQRLTQTLTNPSLAI